MSGRERLAVIGDPVAHSLSPYMHAAALAAAGIPWTYERIRVAASHLPNWFGTEGRALRGFNVTIPHKVAVAGMMDSLDAAARTIGAVNTVVLEGGRSTGYNTDPGGFLAALHHAGFEPSGGSVVIFGAGGAARSVVHALRPLARHIAIANRTLPAAQALARPQDAVVPLDDLELERFLLAADLIVNATSMGMADAPDLCPLPCRVHLRPQTYVIDLVYGRDTPLLRTARESGCRSQDGLEMLVRQGAESFRLWTGIPPDVGVMRDACREQMEIASC